ncbi:MAG TPA: hypothetical protein VHC70_10215, partial [Phycisphaerales bacterium]|nr:hypothetical protein [Phycisphaerales bacterium]
MGLLDRIKKLSAPTDKKTPHVKKLPDFTPKWDREWVIPDNDLQTADIDAGLLVDSKRPTDADPVPVTVETADPLADLVQVPDCELRKKKLVDGAGKKPVVRFTLKDHRIWQPFDKLEYHFTATVDATSKRTDKPIKVKRFHVHALNTHERPAILAIRQEEGANHTGAFSGSQDDVMHRKEFNAEGCAFTDFGGWMRNTYSYMYTGHGGVVCGVCGQMYNCTTAPGPTFGDWIDCRGDSSHNDP